MKLLKTSLAIVLCLLLLISSLLLLSSLFLRNLVFSTTLYADVISAPAYQSMVYHAIVEDLEKQGRYVDIPADVLAQGLDQSVIYVMQQQHIANLVDFLNFRADFETLVYPAERFRAPLQQFIETYAAEHNITVTDDQLELLDAVAEDSSAIVQLHTTLIDLSQIKDISAFQRGHQLIVTISHRLWLASIVWIMALLGLIGLNWRRWRVWLNQVMVTLWLFSSLLMIPMMVLDSIKLHRRLALETSYLQFAVGQAIHSMIQFFLLWGTALFLISSLTLIFLFVTRQEAGRKKTSHHHLSHRVHSYTDE